MSTTINLGRVQGYSAYEVAVQQGYTGTRDEWLASLKGEKGDTGETGATGPTGPQGPKGDQGNTGSSVDYPYELVNNVTTDDATKGLSAAQGVVLNGKITELGQEIEDVESIIDGKQTLFAPNSGYSLINISTLKAGKEYILVNLSTNSIVASGFSFFDSNDITVLPTITGGSQAVNADIPQNGWCSFYVNADVVKINIRYSDASNYFYIVEKDNRLDVLEAESASQQTQLDNIKFEAFQEMEIAQSGGWKDIMYDLKKGLTYNLTKISGTGTVSYLSAYDSNGQLVTVTGFSNLVNINDTCDISVNRDAVKIHAYFDEFSTTDIKSNLQSYTINSIKNIEQEQVEQNTKLGNLEGSVFQLKSFPISGWAGWTSYIFKRGYSYKITNHGPNVLTGYFTLRNGTAQISYTGTISNLSPGSSATIVPNGDATEFNVFSDGDVTVIIEDVTTDVVTNLYELNDSVQIQEGYSSKDDIKHTVIVSKTGASGHFSSIADAYASITDSSYTNQYEVKVFPGKYNENNLQVPPFTHTYAVFPNSVVVTSEGIDGANPVFEQAYSSSKLSHLTIESHTGYCIHFDQDLMNQVLVNTNLILFQAVSNQSAVVGGGAMGKGTKYIWKNCIFKSAYTKAASCHTASGGTNDNTRLIFDSCAFINCSPKVGSVGGNGNDVVELINCSFPIGAEGLGNWFSAIRNEDDPTLYRLNRYAWNIIGGGNKNLSMWQVQSGKTIGLSADYPITISGSAAEIIFGYNPYVNNVKTARLDCSLISEYYIDDSQAGYPPYSEAKDVYQLWKRLGDCSGTNKTLSVTVNGVTKTYTFTEDYLTSKTAQATIIAAMQAVLDNVTINTIVQSGYSYENVNTSDILMVKVSAADILKGEFVTRSGGKATSSTSVADIVGVACEDKPINEYVKVWTSAFRFDADYADGEYGLDANGGLDSGAATKIGFVAGYNFYRY